jgi:hypothetical protein
MLAASSSKMLPARKKDTIRKFLKKNAKKETNNSGAF